jgi:4-oxalocrotonate tautomerase
MDLFRVRSKSPTPTAAGSSDGPQNPHPKFQEDTEMPDVHILWLSGRTVDQKRKVVEGFTKVLMEEAGAKPESTHIVFVDIPHTDFASGGMLVADKNKKT